MELLTLAGAIAGSFVLGKAKGVTNAIDRRAASVTKPVKPLLVYAAALALPKVADWIGVSAPDAEQFIAAPTATVVTIAGYEALKLFRRKTKAGG